VILNYYTQINISNLSPFWTENSIFAVYAENSFSLAGIRINLSYADLQSIEALLFYFCNIFIIFIYLCYMFNLKDKSENKRY
jgi:hypothetical protein